MLRVEDTDQLRIVPDAERKLYEHLKWAGLSWDEGPDVGGPYGPYKQSERLDLYTKYAEQLLNEGHAYRCFCTPEDLDQMRAISMQEGSPTIYNRTCTHIPPDVSARRAANGEPHCVRFKYDHPPVVNDLVYKVYKKPGPEDDFIIVKRDGYPTYHFANVVDDHLMKITHVIRGAEWLVSTPQHIALYEAFGWQIPQFAHVGLLVNEKGQKLSKRTGDADIASWRDRGLLPATLLNYVMLLGWSLGKGVKGQPEAMDLDEMVGKFHLKFTKGNVTINDKYKFLQSVHVKRLVEQSGGTESVVALYLPAVEAFVNSYSISDASRLGPLVPRARPQAGQDGAEAVVSKDYLEKILQLDVRNCGDAATCVLRNEYLIWQIPEGSLRFGLSRLVASISQLLVDETDSEPVREASSLPLETEQGILQTIAEQTQTLRKLLQDIEDDGWTSENIEQVMGPYLKSTDPFSFKKGKRLWKYQLLRWVLVASKPGPGLIPCMAILGKEETTRRVDAACKFTAAHASGASKL